MSAIALSANPILHSKTKHMDLDIYFVRELVANGKIKVKHVPAVCQRADIFTKPVSSKYFTKLRSELTIEEHVEEDQR